MKTYTPVDPLALPAPSPGKGVFTRLRVPDDGDKRKAAIYAAALEAAANALEWIRYRLPNNDGGTAAHTFVPSVADRWIINSTTLAWATNLLATNPENGAHAYMEFFDVPNGVRITSATVTLDPADTHAGLPASLPVLTLRAKNLATGTVTTLGTAKDGSTSLAAYQARHSVTLTVAGGFVFDKSVHKLVAQVDAEQGTNAKFGLSVEGCQLAWTRNE
jgi:hypothetical protein